jgi:hypothetical protein
LGKSSVHFSPKSSLWVTSSTPLNLAGILITPALLNILRPAYTTSPNTSIGPRLHEIRHSTALERSSAPNRRVQLCLKPGFYKSSAPAAIHKIMIYEFPRLIFHPRILPYESTAIPTSNTSYFRTDFTTRRVTYSGRSQTSSGSRRRQLHRGEKLLSNVRCKTGLKTGQNPLFNFTKPFETRLSREERRPKRGQKWTPKIDENPSKTRGLAAG